MRLVIIVLFTLISSFIYSQETKKEIPENLKNDTIIFLAYDYMDIDTIPGLKGIVKNMMKKHYEYAKKSNEQLIEAAKEYPYQYKIMSRADFILEKEHKYRYVLDCPMMEEKNNLQNISGRSIGGVKTVYNSSMVIKDLKDGTIYELFNINQNQVYLYKYIMKKFIKKVNSKFGN